MVKSPREGGAVNEDVLVGLHDLEEDVQEAFLTLRQGHEFDLCTGQIAVGRHDVHPVDHVRHNHLSCR